MTTTTTTTEQDWLGNAVAPLLARSGPIFSPRSIPGRLVDGRLMPSPLAAAALGEAALIAGMKRALKPFPRPTDEPLAGSYPRGGVRIRPDGRFHLRIWLDETMPDPVQGGACETIAEAMNLGALICSYARASA